MKYCPAFFYADHCHIRKNAGGNTWRTVQGKTPSRPKPEGTLFGVPFIKRGSDRTMLALLDLDDHGGTFGWVNIVEAAEKLIAAVEQIGLAPHAFRSAGGKGMHLWFVWDKPQQAAAVRTALGGVLASVGYKNGAGGVEAGEVEIFPKQDKVDENADGNCACMPFRPLDFYFDDYDAGDKYQWTPSAPLADVDIVTEAAEVNTELSVENLEKILEFVPVEGLGYDEWWALVMAIKDAGGSKELAEEWSRKDPDHKNEVIPGHKWDSIKNSRERRVTIRTLMQRASDNGWGGFEADIDEFPVATTGEGWTMPEPIPDELAPVPSFDADLLPTAFRGWIVDVAERMQCPMDFPAVAAMVCLASVVGRQVGIMPKRHDDWLVTPNLWGAVIGRPSLMKSPALAEPIKMVRRLEARALTDHEAEVTQHMAEKMAAEAMEKEAKAAIAKAAKKGREAAVDAAMAMLQEDASEPPKRRRYVTNDSTVAKVGELLRDNPRGILCFRDELVGWLKSLDQQGREGERAFWLETWNGSGSYTFDRIARGTVELDGVCASILGGIQPSVLSAYLGAALHGGAGDDGLMQRLQLIVWPDQPKAWRNVDRWPDTAAKDAAWQVFDRLDNIEPQAIGAQQNEGDDIPWLRFDDEAQAEFDQWREAMEVRIRGDELHPAMESHLAKYRSLVPSLALLIHLADNPQGGSVGAGALLQACAWCEHLEKHAERIYKQAMNGTAAAARALLKKMTELPKQFTGRDVYRKGWRLLDREGVRAALGELVDRDYLRKSQTMRQGRSTTLYRVNPLATP